MHKNIQLKFKQVLNASTNYFFIFPLTLHWNQKYQKAQVTIPVSLHLKLLSLTFPRRQEQCLRKSIDILDNRCP